MISVKLDPIGNDFRIAFNDAVSPESRSRYLAALAKTEIAKADATNARLLGKPVGHKTYVDQVQTDALDRVKPDGTILAEWDIVSPALEFIREQLLKHSPVGKADGRPGHPGLYKASHLLLVDDKIIPDGAKLPETFTRAIFVNTVPYSRKMENASGAGFLSSQAPAGVYQVVAKLAQRRFGNIVSVWYVFQTIDFGHIEAWASTTKMGGKFKRRSDREDWLRRQPAIQVQVR